MKSDRWLLKQTHENVIVVLTFLLFLSFLDGCRERRIKEHITKEVTEQCTIKKDLTN